MNFVSWGQITCQILTWKVCTVWGCSLGRCCYTWMFSSFWPGFWATCSCIDQWQSAWSLNPSHLRRELEEGFHSTCVEATGGWYEPFFLWVDMLFCLVNLLSEKVCGQREVVAYTSHIELRGVTSRIVHTGSTSICTIDKTHDKYYVEGHGHLCLL